MQAALATALARMLGHTVRIEHLRRLSGGAVQEIWAFDATGDDTVHKLVMRRARGALRASRPYGVSLADEARAMLAAGQGGVPVPHVRGILSADDGLGDGFVMDFVAGESIPRRILRDTAYAPVRATLAEVCGSILARLHAVDSVAFDFAGERTPRGTLMRLRSQYDELDRPSPVFELAFRRLAETAPDNWPKPLPVHGDFRHGNLLVRPDGLAAVLDWENVHLGDPHEDLAYICLAPWRFGNLALPVGGFGRCDQLFAAYHEAGGSTVEPARFRFWLLAFTLEWGLTCALFARQFTNGMDPAVERGALGRRRSEAELDVLRLLDWDELNDAG